MDTNIKSPILTPAWNQTLDILRNGTVELQGLFRLGSNDTFLCSMQSPLGILRAVYKPIQGERPLWDFPSGTLGNREVAAYHVARIAGWNFVPPTVFREEGPLGPGSFQEYLPLKLEENYFFLREQDPDTLRQVAAFDVVINNADRKAMHVARDPSGRTWLIDHGVCFHVQWKVRTVIWEFAGEDLPTDIRNTLMQLRLSQTELRDVLGGFLHADETEAMEMRIDALLAVGKFPEPGFGRSIPWPIMA